MNGISGIKEVFKYCFKDIDITNFEIFKNLYLGLRSKRIRQCYGMLYRLKLNDKDLGDDEVIEDIKNYLEFKDEVPKNLMISLEDINKKFGDYKKVSIYKKSKN